jgi:hypothetical protein
MSFASFMLYRLSFKLSFGLDMSRSCCYSSLGNHEHHRESYYDLPWVIMDANKTHVNTYVAASRLFHQNSRSAERFMFTPRRSVSKLEWSQAWALADWLNQGNTETADRQEEVAELVRLLHDMDSLWRKGEAAPDDSNEGRERRRRWARAREILEELENARVNLFKWGIAPLKTPRRRHVLHMTWNRNVGYALLQLSDVSKAGLVGNLRECKLPRCRKWFLATKGRQQFCSPDCQAEFWDDYRHTEAGKEEMREYMRCYRRGRKHRRRQAARKSIKGGDAI